MRLDALSLVSRNRAWGGHPGGMAATEGSKQSASAILGLSSSQGSPSRNTPAPSGCAASSPFRRPLGTFPADAEARPAAATAARGSGSTGLGASAHNGARGRHMSPVGWQHGRRSGKQALMSTLWPHRGDRLYGYVCGDGGQPGQGVAELRHARGSSRLPAVSGVAAAN